MANITAADIKELRERSGIGMLDCKNALIEANGDKEAAIKILKDKGMVVAAERAGREAKEGLILVQNKGNVAYMIKVGCETDFVAKNSDFITLCDSFMSAYVEKGDTYLASPEFVAIISDASARIGEKIVVSDAVTEKIDNGFTHTYLHFNKKVGVIIKVECDAAIKSNPKTIEFANDVALQVAAMSPIALTQDDVPQNIRDEQRANFVTQMADSGKPADIVAKIVDGKVNKHFSELCLMDMAFVKENKISIKDLQAQVSKEVGSPLKIVKFVKLAIGE